MTTLLPHGITLPSSHDQNNIKSPSHLLTSNERDTLIYSNMYSLPPSIMSSSSTSTTILPPSSPSILTTTITSTINPPPPHPNPHNMMTTSSTLEQQRKEEILNYGKNPIRHKDSTLSGETLNDVNKSLEQWLCRLADTCPIDESSIISSNKIMNGNGNDNDNDIDIENKNNDEIEISKNEIKKYSSMELIPNHKSSNSLKISNKKLGKYLSNPVLESIYQQSGLTEKHTPIAINSNSNSNLKEENESLIQKLVITNHQIKKIKNKK